MITALTIVCGVLVFAVAFLLWQSSVLMDANKRQWALLTEQAKRIDDLNSINLTVQQRLETATELSLLNNKFIETVKKTAEEQVSAAKSRIATIQSRGVR